MLVSQINLVVSNEKFERMISLNPGKRLLHREGYDLLRLPSQGIG